MSKEYLSHFCLVSILLLAWWTLCDAFHIPTFILPTPFDIFKAFAANTQQLYSNFVITATEAILGFLIANILAFSIAFLLQFLPSLERLLIPYFVGVKSVPLVAFAPLLALWFGFGLISKVIMAAIVAFFPLLVNLLTGLDSTDKNMLDLFRTLSASRLELFFKLRLPAAMPYLFSALKISAPLSVVGAIVAELSGAEKGLGYQITIAAYKLDVPLVFASILIASCLGIFFYTMILVVERHAWYKKAGLYGNEYKFN